jgi:hypothetical protein
MSTVEGIQRSLQFNFALLDRLPRRPNTEIKERTRLLNRIRDPRAELAKARARNSQQNPVFPNPKPFHQ